MFSNTLKLRKNCWKNVEKMLIYQKCGWEVWALQIEVVHMYACRSKSGCARYVRATKKRVVTHTLIVSSKCFSETDVMRDTPGSFLWETVLKVICIYICDSFHLYLIGLTPLLGDRRGFMPPQLKKTKKQNCSECQNKNNNLFTQHVLQVFWAYSFHEHTLIMF